MTWVELLFPVVLLILAVAFLLAAALAFWSSQHWQWGRMERGLEPRFTAWRKSLVSIPEPRTFSELTNMFRLALRSVRLLFTPDPSQPDLERLRVRARRYLRITVALWLAILMDLIAAGFYLVNAD